MLIKVIRMVYEAKENKLMNKIAEARTIMEESLGTTKTKVTQVKRLKPLIQDKQLSNLKRAFWIGFLLGKHNVDYYESLK